jgi:hypothetical protein
MKQLGSNWTDFHEIWAFFESVEKIQVQLKSDNNNGYFTWRPMYIYNTIALNAYLEWEIFQTKVVEKIKTRVLWSIIFPESRAVYDIMRTNMVEPDRPQMTIYMAHALCVLDNYGYRHTLRIWNISCFWKQWFRERASKLHLYAHCLSCLTINHTMESFCATFSL